MQPLIYVDSVLRTEEVDKFQVQERGQHSSNCCWNFGTPL